MYRSILVIADQDCNQRAAMRKARSAAFCDGVDISVVASVQPCAGGAADTTGEKKHRNAASHRYCVCRY